MKDESDRVRSWHIRLGKILRESRTVPRACLHCGVAVTLALFTLTETKFARERGNLHDESSYSPAGLSRPLRDGEADLEDCERTLQKVGRMLQKNVHGGSDSDPRKCESPPDCNAE